MIRNMGLEIELVLLCVCKKYTHIIFVMQYKFIYLIFLTKTL